ncbi:MAG TPA: lysophospholipid acyltransferase family protein [Baekduia sp.]|nr:lysophospholipid acyltransferase family protein [Baekduia sp.]
MATRIRDLLIGVYASPSTHRLAPARLALPVLATLEPALRQRRNPVEGIDAERLMSDLLQYTPRRDEARAVARRHLRERSRVRELFWRPWLIKHSRVIGREHWDAAHSGGRGCVLVLGHLGGSWAIPAILGRHSFDVHMVSSAHFWRELPPGLLGRSHRHLREAYGERWLGADRLIPNDAPPERLVELVEQGATVGIAFDVPGSAATPFLGRSVALASGPASLAFRTKAKVLPVITERHGTRMDLRMLEPLDAADHRDLRSLRAAIARTYEPLIVERPEMVEIAWYPSPLVTEALTSQAPDAPQVAV